MQPDNRATRSLPVRGPWAPSANPQVRTPLTGALVPEPPPTGRRSPEPGPLPDGESLPPVSDPGQARGTWCPWRHQSATPERGRLHLARTRWLRARAWVMKLIRRPGRRRMHDAGMATAEYAIATLAACGFAALLLAILRSGEMRGLLLGIIRRALAVQ